MSGRGLAADFVVARSGAFALDLQLDLPPGRTIALLGPNGAGKSTAVGALAGLLAIDSGSITFGDDVLDDPSTNTFVPPEERRIGVVFQDGLLFPHLDVLDNVAFGLRSSGVSKDDAAAEAGLWLERLGLDGLATRRPGDLSGGQAQRVGLARALAARPAALLLDEPLSALDVTGRGELRHLLSRHLDEFAGPRLVITHEPTEAFLLADEIHVIESGAITQRGTADDILLRPATPYAADLAGSNLLVGSARNGVIDVEGRLIHAGGTAVDDGPVLVTIRPTAITVHVRPPEGSQRNSWPTTVDRVEQLGPRVRFRTTGPPPLTVEITESARSELALEPGSEIWVAFKATEIEVRPIGGAADGGGRADSVRSDDH